MTHIAHPDVHDHGLADGCPGCDELAANPIRDLDSRMLHRLTKSGVDRASRGTDWTHPAGALGGAARRATSDVIAETAILNVLERVGRLAEVAPDEVARYLRERWHLDASISNPRAPELAALRARLEGDL